MDDYNFAGVLGNLIFVFSSLRARTLVQGILQRNQSTQTVISSNNNNNNNNNNNHHHHHHQYIY